MPNPRKKYTIEEARAFAKKNPKQFNAALDKINPDPYRGTKKLADLLIKQYPERYKDYKPEDFISMLDSISKVESGNQNIAQKSINPKTKKIYDGPARGYFQIETNTAPTASKRYQNYQDILKKATAVPLPDIQVPKSGDVRSLSKDEQARLALSNMSATAASRKQSLNPLNSQDSWLNYHWNGSETEKPARQSHWKETFGYGGGGAVGGKLKNQVEPTRADSLDLLNNTKSLENYYSKYNKSYSSAQDASEVNVHALNKNSADTFFTSGASVKVPRKDGTSMDLKRELFPKDQYYKKVDNNRYYQRELADRILDTRAPMALYDKRIAPNNLTAYLNDIPNDGMNGDGITIYGYDPLSVTPWDMLNSKDKANRISQFGIAGTPYKSVEEYKASKSVSKPTQQFQDTVVVPQVTPEAQTQINTGSSTPVTLGMSSPDSSTGKRLYRYGNKDITEQEFNKYKTLGKHKIVEYGGGGEIYYSDPNKFIEAQQAYNDSTNYYNFMHSERRKIPHGADPKAWMNSKEANDLLIEESNLQGAVMDRNTRAGVKLGKLPYPTLPVSKPVFRPTHANGGVIDTNTYGKQDVPDSVYKKYEALKHKKVEYGLGGTIGSLLQAAAPVAGLIPGVGTLVGAAAGVVGNGLQQLDSGQKWDPTQTIGAGIQGATGMKVPGKMAQGGMTGLVPVNIEGYDVNSISMAKAKKGELLVNNGNMIKNYISRPPHPERGQNPLGDDEVQPGSIVIPKNRSQEYLNAGRALRKQIEASVVSQQVAREGNMMRKGGQAGRSKMLPGAEDPGMSSFDKLNLGQFGLSMIPAIGDIIDATASVQTPQFGSLRNVSPNLIDPNTGQSQINQGYRSGYNSLRDSGVYSLKSNRNLVADRMQRSGDQALNIANQNAQIKNQFVGMNTDINKYNLDMQNQVELYRMQGQAKRREARRNLLDRAPAAASQYMQNGLYAKMLGI